MSTHRESNRNAFNGPSGLPAGGGILSMMACKTASTPFPVFAEMCRTSAGSMPKVACICAAIRSGCAAGRSILLRTGIMVRPLSLAM